MSSPPSERTLEGLIEDAWGPGAVRPDVLAILEPYREDVENALDAFIDDEQSWRDYSACIWGGWSDSDEGVIPRAVLRAVQELLTKPVRKARYYKDVFEGGAAFIGEENERFQISRPISFAGHKTSITLSDPTPGTEVTIAVQPDRVCGVTIGEITLQPGHRVVFTAASVEGPLREGEARSCAWVPGNTTTTATVIDVLEIKGRTGRLLALQLLPGLHFYDYTVGELLHSTLCSENSNLNWLVVSVERYPTGIPTPTGALLVVPTCGEQYPAVGDKLYLPVPKQRTAK